ncbi:MAG: deoxyribodipyrimidine photolyase [Gammaproteobacteria bacterium]|nr:deoxyribodipyrimidine photolyase [Gammaproteobacteria bacterium]|tara:strand:+ start:4230 stop:5570 length:1341 start_codon:yes stop_codon:yes gene_type:complete
MLTTLYWFTQDLRLDDNPALTRAAQSDALLCVYCVNRRWFNPHRYHISAMGTHRWHFLQQSLDALSAALAGLNQHLYIEHGYPEQQLIGLIARHRITRLVCSRQFGSDERKVLRLLAERFPGLEIEEVDSTTLFDQQQLPMAPPELLKGFTPFRQQAEQLQVPPPAQTPMSLPRPVLRAVPAMALPEWIPGSYRRPAASQTSLSIAAIGGGEPAGKQQLHDYFSSQLPSSYKQVRNKLDGWENSTKLSPWLNQGCLSPRRVTQVLRQYEQRHGQNESTGWLYFELLWREYFQWLAQAQGDRLYALKGIADKPQHGCLHPERYQKWCHGNTPWPLVNACMRQLKETGYLSNRGRQIAASCFINELGMDWRYGAAWFEHQLIDYDVAVNWGNWQYIAGVGVDPRGGRHFDIEKQTALHDPDRAYINRWAPDAPELALDSVDAADWPIS